MSKYRSSQKRKFIPIEKKWDIIEGLHTKKYVDGIKCRYEIYLKRKLVVVKGGRSPPNF